MLVESEDLMARAILLDLRDAIDKAELTQLERQAIRAVYMDDPSPPTRTGAAHRPSGGSTREGTATSIGISRATLWKVLNSALLKIEDTLNYKEDSERHNATTPL